MSDAPPLHPNVEALAALLGGWSGRGRGEYPTIDGFDYVETVSFSHVGKPFLAYSQRTRRLMPDGTVGEPLHAETGYWRCPSPGRVEIVIAHPTGIVEVQEGSIDGEDDNDDFDATVITTATTAITGTATAKRVDAVERVFRLDGDRLEYRVAMAAVGQPLQHHLAASLGRS